MNSKSLIALVLGQSYNQVVFKIHNSEESFYTYCEGIISKEYCEGIISKKVLVLLETSHYTGTYITCPT